MDQLWAPWRMEYITGAGSGAECIFCAFPSADPSCDPANLVLHRGAHAFVLLNAFPYASGHLMVAPYRHTSRIGDLGGPELSELMALQRAAALLLEREYSPDGLNLGANLGRAAGAGIDAHLHWHVVPRWAGDTNFMTVTGQVRVIPEALCATYDRLRSAAGDVFSDLAVG